MYVGFPFCVPWFKFPELSFTLPSNLYSAIKPFVTTASPVIALPVIFFHISVNISAETKERDIINTISKIKTNSALPLLIPLFIFLINNNNNNNNNNKDLYIYIFYTSSAPISQNPLLISPSMSVLKARLASELKSIPESFADVSKDERWRSLFVLSTNKTILFLNAVSGEVASEEISLFDVAPLTY